MVKTNRLKKSQTPEALSNHAVQELLINVVASTLSNNDLDELMAKIHRAMGGGLHLEFIAKDLKKTANTWANLHDKFGVTKLSELDPVFKRQFGAVKATLNLIDVELDSFDALNDNVTSIFGIVMDHDCQIMRLLGRLKVPVRTINMRGNVIGSAEDKLLTSWSELLKDGNTLTRKELLTMQQQLIDAGGTDEATKL